MDANDDAIAGCDALAAVAWAMTRTSTAPRAPGRTDRRSVREPDAGMSPRPQSSVVSSGLA
jgi:hypothetical protein